MKYTISDTDLHIEDSYKVDMFSQMHSFLLNTQRMHPESQVWTRSIRSLTNEWRGHNLLYDLHLFRSHTKDVDLDVPTKWYTEIIYAVLAAIYKIVR